MIKVRNLDKQNKLFYDDAIQLVEDYADFDENMELTVEFPDLIRKVTEKWHKSRIIGELYASDDIEVVDDCLCVKTDYNDYGYVYIPLREDDVKEYLQEKEEEYKVEDNIQQEPSEIEIVTYNYQGKYEEYKICEESYINQLKQLLKLPMTSRIIVMQETGLKITGLITVKTEILIDVIKQLKKICSSVTVYVYEDSISLMGYFKEE